MMLWDSNSNTFTGLPGTPQRMTIGFHAIDYYLALVWLNYEGDMIVFRGQGGWGLFDELVHVYPLINNLITGSYGKLLLPERLTNSPIVLFHEHEQKDESQTRIIFQKEKFDGTYILKARLVQWVYEILVHDFTVTIWSPQRRLFEWWIQKAKDWILVTEQELYALNYFLQKMFEIQKKYYKAQVYELLSILPSP